MDLASTVLWIFLALMIAWIGLILIATWCQVRDEASRVADRDEP